MIETIKSTSRNKMYIIASAVFVIVLAAAGFFMVRGSQQKKPEPPAQNEPTGRIIPTVDSSVTVDVKSLPGNKIMLAIAGIPDGTLSIDYEITYETRDGGLQGVSSSVETEEKSTYEKDFLLGTCSSGGACVFHQVSGPVKVSLKFNGAYGARLFEQEYEL